MGIWAGEDRLLSAGFGRTPRFEDVAATADDLPAVGQAGGEEVGPGL